MSGYARCFAALALLMAACHKPEPKLTRDDVTAGLQQEANKMKADGENMPDVGVKATWNIVAVDIKEQPDNPGHPFTGTVRFKIDSSAHALEGSAAQSFEKKFEYEYDAASKRWRFKS
jgi:hypothetical protein